MSPGILEAPGTPLALLRHGVSEWNQLRRMQGQTDIPLSAEGRAALTGLCLPPAVAGWTLLSSPLIRATETARLVSGREPRTDPRLMEADLGDWVGHTLAELRAADPAGMAEIEGRGLDRRPPGGESPRDVQHRLAPLLAEIAEAGRPTVAVCHKGVIRALMARATGWDMLGKPPVRLDWERLHLFSLDAAGAPSLVAANLPLAARS